MASEVPQRTAPGEADHVAAAVGTAVLLLLQLLAFLLAFTNGIRSDPCDGDCAFGVIEAGVLTTLAAPAAVIIAAAATMVPLRRRGRRIGWVPFAGVPLVVLVWIGSFAIADLGLPGGALAP